MRHFLVMALFAALASMVFGAMAKDTTRERLIYGLKVFAEFMVIGLVLSWVLYFIPWAGTSLKVLSFPVVWAFFGTLALGLYLVSRPSKQYLLTKVETVHPGPTASHRVIEKAGPTFYR